MKLVKGLHDRPDHHIDALPGLRHLGVDHFDVAFFALVVKYMCNVLISGRKQTIAPYVQVTSTGNKFDCSDNVMGYNFSYV